MDRAYRNLILPGGLVALGAWLAFGNSSTGDYPSDAGPAVSALAHGHVGAYLAAHPVMGPAATLLETPFALLGHGESSEYRWVCFGCALALAALGVILFDLARKHRASTLSATLIALLCIVNPVTTTAFQTGHPEELLTAALAIGAVVVAAEGRSIGAGLLLGLAIASKQWAVLATLPVLMALPSGRRRAAAIGLAIVAASILPTLIASPGSFFDTQGNAASGGANATIWSAWYAVSPTVVHRIAGGTVDLHEIPQALRPLTHPMIVAAFFLVPIAVWARRGKFGLSPERAIALVALLALVRCALDPVDNLYYHAPLLLALLAWDAIGPPGRLPLRGLAAAGVLAIFSHWSANLGDLEAFNLAYVAVVALTGSLICSRLFDRRRTVAPIPTPARRAETV